MIILILVLVLVLVLVLALALALAHSAIALRLLIIPPQENIVYDADFFSFLGREIFVTLHHVLDVFKRVLLIPDCTIEVFPVYLIDLFSCALDLGCIDQDVARWALRPAKGLVYHNTTVRQGESFSFLTTREQQRPHRCRLA